MAIRKRKTKSGVSWGYYFDLQGSTREQRITITEWGFASRKKAQEAEADRRIEERRNAEARARGIVAAVPRTLRELLDEFCREHADKDLALKTAARYRELMSYLASELLDSQVGDIMPEHLTREWERLRASGGRHRRTKASRPLSVKTVRNIAGLVSSAFARAMGRGLARMNPVTASTKPRGGARRQMAALSPAQQRLLLDASNHWLLPDLLEVCAGLGARRGEVLALRWSDIGGDQARIGRSLTQARGALAFKEPKTESGYRVITVPPSTLAVMEARREKQRELREQYGLDYRVDLDLVFCNPDGSPVRPDTISAVASALCRRLKLPKGVSLHTLRHTHGSQLIAGGMELPAVSARLGHSSPHVTAKIYAHMLGGRDREAARVWEAMQEKRPEGEARKQ